MPLPRAAAYLGLPEDGVLALVAAGYLATAGDGPEGPEFRLGDLKAFLARNADNGSGNVVDFEPLDPHVLLDALAAHAGDMARRSFEIFAALFPDARSWSHAEQARFVERARGRFEAVLAVAAGGAAAMDEGLVAELEEVGAEAAREAAPLSPLLGTLRISRDLVVRTAVQLAEEGGRRWGLALSLVLPRVLPAVDRLTDALAHGYRTALVEGAEERRALLEHVVESVHDGVYEIDLHGRIRYANPALAILLARRPDQLEGALLADLFTPLDHALSLDALARPPAAAAVELPVVRHDGVRLVLEVHTVRRMAAGELVGFQGVVRDVTSRREREAGRTRLLALVAADLRRPLRVALGLAAAAAMGAGGPGARVAGASARRELERALRLVDDVEDLGRLEAGVLQVEPRAADLAAVVRAAVGTVAGAEGVELRVPAGVVVHVDVKRFEQVVANLVENALHHGRPPVVVELAGSGARGAEVAVTDAGAGVPAVLEPALFDLVQTLARPGRDRALGTGMGLALVKGLIEAMGGRVWYERAPGGGASFRIAVPSPHLRPTAPVSR